MNSLLADYSFPVRRESVIVRPIVFADHQLQRVASH